MKQFEELIIDERLIVSDLYKVAKEGAKPQYIQLTPMEVKELQTLFAKGQCSLLKAVYNRLKTTKFYDFIIKEQR
jgi:hypothetical protein